MVLLHGCETQTFGSERVAHAHRPPWHHRSVAEGEREDEVLRAAAALLGHHGVEKQGLRLLIDGGRTGDAFRVDVPAGELTMRDGRPQGSLPYRGPRFGVQRVHIVVFGGDDKEWDRGAGRVPVQRLGVDVAGDFGPERLIEVDRSGTVPGQLGYYIVS